MKKRIFTLCILGFLIVFLGHEYWQTNPGQARVFVRDGLVVGQEASGQAYLLGDPALWSQTKPLGYFYPSQKIIKLMDIEVGVAQSTLTRWSENFAVLTLNGYRIFWFGSEFSFNEIQQLPISFKADIWIVNGVVPPAQMSLPKQLVVWANSQKNISKKWLKKITAASLPVFETKALGEFWLYEKEGTWTKR